MRQQAVPTATLRILQLPQHNHFRKIDRRSSVIVGYENRSFAGSLYNGPVNLVRFRSEAECTFHKAIVADLRSIRSSFRRDTDEFRQLRPMPWMRSVALANLA
jgi:hypothetical protein